MGMTSWWDKKKKTRALVLALCLSMGTGVAGATESETSADIDSETVVNNGEKLTVNNDIKESGSLTVAEGGAANFTGGDTSETTATLGSGGLNNDGAVNFNANKTTIKATDAAQNDAVIWNAGTVTFNGSETKIESGHIVTGWNTGETVFNSSDKTEIAGTVGVGNNATFSGKVTFNSNQTTIGTLQATNGEAEVKKGDTTVTKSVEAAQGGKITFEGTSTTVEGKNLEAGHSAVSNKGTMNFNAGMTTINGDVVTGEKNDDGAVTVGTTNFNSQVTIGGIVSATEGSNVDFKGVSTTLSGEKITSDAGGKKEAFVQNDGTMTFGADTTEVKGDVNTGASGATTFNGATSAAITGNVGNNGGMVNFNTSNTTIEGSVTNGRDADNTRPGGTMTFGGKTTIKDNVLNNGIAIFSGETTMEKHFNNTNGTATFDGVTKIDNGFENAGTTSFSGTATITQNNGNANAVQQSFGTVAFDGTTTVNGIVAAESKFGSTKLTFDGETTLNGVDKTTDGETRTIAIANGSKEDGNQTATIELNGANVTVRGNVENYGRTTFNAATTTMTNGVLANSHANANLAFTGDTLNLTGIDKTTNGKTIKTAVENTAGTVTLGAKHTTITGDVNTATEGTTNFTGETIEITGDIGNKGKMMSNAATIINGSIHNAGGAMNLNGNTVIRGGKLAVAPEPTTRAAAGPNTVVASNGIDITPGSDGVAIENNNGTIIIKKDAANANAAQNIRGKVVHGEDAIKTEITLSGADSALNGAVAGTAAAPAEQFSLTLDKEAKWYVDSAQFGEAVSNVTLNGGASILSPSISGNAVDGFVNTASGSGDYGKLTLNNFNGDGTGKIALATNIAATEGDQLALTGGSKGGVNVYIADKNNISELEGKGEGLEIVTEGADKVKIAVHTPDGYDSETGYHYKVNTVQDGEKILIGAGGVTKDHAKPVQRSHEDGKIINEADLENVFRRLNDLRANPEDAGVWVRMDRNRTDVKDNKYNMTAIGGGYDWMADTGSSSVYYGFGVGYSAADGETGALGDGKATSGQLYASWLGKKNKDYVDLVVKYGKLRENYSGLDEYGWYTAGNYRKDLMALSLKYGRRIQTGGGFYFEPQLGYTYGSVGSADYTDSDGARIHAGRMNSHILSAGIQAGQRVKDTEFYGRLAYVYDTDGKMDVSAYNRTMTDDMGGGFLRVALGVSHKLDDINSLYFDLGRDFGSTIERSYSVSLGFSCAF